MNPFRAKSILFPAVFDEDGQLTHLNQEAFEECLKAASMLSASVMVVHVKSYSDRITWNPEYDNSPKQRKARRIDYALTGMRSQAEVAKVELTTRVLFGDVQSVLAALKDTAGIDLVWTDEPVKSESWVPRAIAS